MTNTSGTKVVAAARVSALAAVLSAASVVVGLVEFAGAAHAAPSYTNSQSGMHGDPAAAHPSGVIR